MTEYEWQTCVNLSDMLNFLKQRRCERKLRLFACECFRRVWSLLFDCRSKEAVIIVERFVDEKATLPEYFEVKNKYSSPLSPVGFAFEEAGMVFQNNPVFAASSAASVAQDLVFFRGMGASPGAELLTAEDCARCKASEMKIQCDLLRDIFGNPFHPISIQPTWLTSTVIALATEIYNKRAFDRVPILADALQDADCSNKGILNHCRQVGNHAKGCWVIDLILSKC